MEKDKLHFISGNGTNILYYDPTMSIIPVGNVILDETKDQCQQQADKLYMSNKKDIDRIIENGRKPEIRENQTGDL